MPYSPLRPYPKSSGLDPNYAPDGMLACLPERGDPCRGCAYCDDIKSCISLPCEAMARPDGLSVIFKPR